MQIFGLPVWPEKISDEQYVERIRKGLRTMRRWRYIFALGYLGIIIAFIVFIFLGVHVIFDLAGIGQTTKHHAAGAGSGPDPQIAYAIYYLAVVFGGWLGFMLGHAVSNVAIMLFWYRKDKLLVEFWDALSDAEKARLRQTSS